MSIFVVFSAKLWSRGKTGKKKQKQTKQISRAFSVLSVIYVGSVCVCCAFVLYLRFEGMRRFFFFFCLH
jgi:hypothetical protein